MQKPLLIILILALLAGCAPKQPVDPGTAPPANGMEETLPEAEPVPEEETMVEDIDLELIRPNELGRVMVLMYHEVGQKEDTWARHYENFRKDMELLYNEGYRPVNLQDFLAGNIDIPAGNTPFILTFDDGTAGQFRLIEQDGQWVVDPDCAVGILMEMNRKYPDFKLAGTFYIYYPVPFRQKDLIAQKLKMLVEMGFEIGNHTMGHENLKKISPEEGTKAIARQVIATQEYLPGYRVSSLALPYGERPKDDAHLASGEFEGITYENKAILLVGANPAPSPFDKRFDPLRLPRVRADETELNKWLEHFRKNPDDRYISDGDPGKITVPRSLSQYLSEMLDTEKIRFYDRD